MGETRVDLLHLLEDLRDAYPGPLEETILTEIVANSLDSGAGQIRLAADLVEGALTVIDNGSGMQRGELRRYHDLGASAKSRGEGIGFAGVGIKLALLVCKEVWTETRRGKTHVATCWQLSSRHRAPWKWAPPPGLVVEHGTAVRLKLPSALSPLLDEGFLEGTLRCNFQPLLDPAFEEILGSHYPQGVRFDLNGRRLEKQGWQGREGARLEVLLARKRKPAAVGYLIREDHPLPEDRRGVAVSTFGKVIKRGWEWLGITPSAPERVGGLIEAPALAACLTLSKSDFIRAGARGAVYLGYRKAIQQTVSRQLAAWGEGREATEEARRRRIRPWERDLEGVLVNLADQFPLLASLVERRAGGQKRLPVGTSGEPGEGEASLMAFRSQLKRLAEGVEAVVEPSPEAHAQGEVAEAEPPAPGERKRSEGGARLLGGRGLKRPVRYGLGIGYEQRPGDPELGRLVESTVLVNEGHPAYRRAVASRSEGYHIAMAVALALAPLAVEPKDEHAFVTAFLSRWGEALQQPAPRKRQRR